VKVEIHLIPMGIIPTNLHTYSRTKQSLIEGEMEEGKGKRKLGEPLVLFMHEPR
jgi:hypothetical protein